MTMPKDIHPNFLRPPTTSMSRVFMGAIGVGVLGALIYTGSLGGGVRTASIEQALPSTTPTPTPTAAMPGRAPSLHPISTGTATALAQGVGSVVQYYERGTGKVFSIDLKTATVHTLSDAPLAGFADSLWAPDGQHVVSIFDTTKGRQYRSFDYTTKRAAVVGTNTISAAFSPNSQRLAFIERGDDTATLFVANVDGSDARRVLQTRASNPSISWPQDNTLALETDSGNGVGRDLVLTNLAGEISVLLTNKKNLQSTWSPDGTTMLYSHTDASGKTQLTLTSASLGAPVALPITTSAQKCAWTNTDQSIVCGVPTQGLLSLDGPAQTSTTSDALIAINLASGEQSTVYTPKANAPLSVERAVISKDGKYFVFLNTFDHRVYSVPLP